jgi:hypothetical protein
MGFLLCLAARAAGNYFHPNTKWFTDRKEGIFRPGKEIKGLRGGILQYVAQAITQIAAARAKKRPFRMKTIYSDIACPVNGIALP